MTPETEALRRCQRLLALMAEAMRMERAVEAHSAASDAPARSLIRPIFERALQRLEPMRDGRTRASLQQWLRELDDLELALGAAFAQHGWPPPAGAAPHGEPDAPTRH